MHEVRMLAVDLMRMEELLLDTLVLVQTCWNVLKFEFYSQTFQVKIPGSL